MAYPCRICSHDCLYEEAGIMCDGCQNWMHQECVGMTMCQFTHFSIPHLQFYCFRCSHLASGDFNCLASLSRIEACKPDIQRMREQAESEENLLAFYKVMLPTVTTVKVNDVTVHQGSVSMLKDHNPWLLHQFVPADVVGDGNCLIRSISLAILTINVQQITRTHYGLY